MIKTLFLLISIFFSTYLFADIEIYRCKIKNRNILVPKRDNKELKDELIKFFSVINPETTTCEKITETSFEKNKARSVVLSGSCAGDMVSKFKEAGSQVDQVDELIEQSSNFFENFDKEFNEEEKKAYFKVISSFYDSVVVPGGPGVDPLMWGGVTINKEEVAPFRDKFHINLLRYFLKNGKGMVYGACFGQLTITAALGGKNNERIVGVDTPGAVCQIENTKLKFDGDNIQIYNKDEPNVLKKAIQDCRLPNNEFKLRKSHRQGILTDQENINVLEKFGKVVATTKARYNDVNSPIVEIIDAFQLVEGRGLTTQFHPELEKVFERIPLANAILKNFVDESKGKHGLKTKSEIEESKFNELQFLNDEYMKKKENLINNIFPLASRNLIREIYDYRRAIHLSKFTMDISLGNIQQLIDISNDPAKIQVIKDEFKNLVSNDDSKVNSFNILPFSPTPENLIKLIHVGMIEKNDSLVRNALNYANGDQSKLNEIRTWFNDPKNKKHEFLSKLNPMIDNILSSNSNGHDRTVGKVGNAGESDSLGNGLKDSVYAQLNLNTIEGPGKMAKSIQNVLSGNTTFTSHQGPLHISLSSMPADSNNRFNSGEVNKLKDDMKGFTENNLIGVLRRAKEVDGIENANKDIFKLKLKNDNFLTYRDKEVSLELERNDFLKSIDDSLVNMFTQNYPGKNIKKNNGGFHISLGRVENRTDFETIKQQLQEKLNGDQSLKSQIEEWKNNGLDFKKFEFLFGQDNNNDSKSKLMIDIDNTSYGEITNKQYLDAEDNNPVEESKISKRDVIKNQNIPKEVKDLLNEIFNGQFPPLAMEVNNICNLANVRPGYDPVKAEFEKLMQVHDIDPGKDSKLRELGLIEVYSRLSAKEIGIGNQIKTDLEVKFWEAKKRAKLVRINSIVENRSRRVLERKGKDDLLDGFLANGNNLDIPEALRFLASYIPEQETRLNEDIELRREEKKACLMEKLELQKYGEVKNDHNLTNIFFNGLVKEMGKKNDVDIMKVNNDSNDRSKVRSEVYRKIRDLLEKIKNNVKLDDKNSLEIAKLDNQFKKYLDNLKQRIQSLKVKEENILLGSPNLISNGTFTNAFNE